MEWTRSQVLEFVQFYKQRTILWDPRHPVFYNRAEKGNAWVEVAQEMGKPVEECKRKMDYLLAAMRREKQKIKKTIGVGRGAYNLYKSRWYAFDSLRFLLDKREPLNCVKTEAEDDTLEASEDDTEDPLTDMIIPDLESNVESTSLTTVPITNPLKRRATTVFDEGSDSPIDFVRTGHEDSNDDCQLFGNLIAAKLRKFNENVKTCLQSEIMALFVKASRGAYNIPFSEHPIFHQSEHPADTQ